MSWFKKLLNRRKDEDVDPTEMPPARTTGSSFAVHAMQRQEPFRGAGQRKMSLSAVDNGNRDNVKIITVSDITVRPDTVKAYVVYCINVTTAMGFSHVCFRTHREFQRLRRHLIETYPELEALEIPQFPRSPEHEDENNKKRIQLQHFLTASSVLCRSQNEEFNNFLDVEFFDNQNSAFPNRSSSTSSQPQASPLKLAPSNGVDRAIEGENEAQPRKMMISRSSLSSKSATALSPLDIPPPPSTASSSFGRAQSVQPQRPLSRTSFDNDGDHQQQSDRDQRDRNPHRIREKVFARSQGSLVALNGLARLARDSELERDAIGLLYNSDDEEEDEVIVYGDGDELFSYNDGTSKSKKQEKEEVTIAASPMFHRADTAASIPRPSTPSGKKLRPLLLAVKSMAKMKNAVKIPPTPQDFVPLCKIGQGGYSKVFLCRLKSTSPQAGTLKSDVVAVKKMAKTKIGSKNQVALVEKERHLLVLGSTSPWLVSFHSFFQDEKFLYLAMEYIPGGDLRALLNNIGCLSRDDAKFYLSEIICAVRDLHRFGYIHRDLKPENLLVAADGHLKLSDFGLSKDSDTVKRELSSLSTLSEEETPAPASTSSNPKSKKVTQKTPRTAEGTPYYMAPEIVRREDYTLSVDWWSVGVILFEMVAGFQPFRGSTPLDVCQSVLDHEHLTKPTVGSVAAYADDRLRDDGSIVGEIVMEGEDVNKDLIDEVTWDLITKLLCEKEKRLSSFGDIRSHPFFDGVEWQAMRKPTVVPPFVPELDDVTDTGYFDVEAGDENRLEWFEQEQVLRQMS